MLPLRAILLLITISVVKGHYSCPELGDIPLSTTQGCEWVVSQDWRGCLEYVEECEHHYNCEVNELMWRCSSHCAPTCRNPHPICDLECGPPACQCAGGYVRDDDGHCVRLHDCHSHEPPHLTACAANELLNTCGSMCEPTCFTDPSAPCSDVCGPPMCACRPGLVRHNGICIWRDQCPNFRSEDHHESMVGAPNNDESMIRAPNNDESMLRAPQQVQPMAFLCTANEEFVECSSLCEPTCNSPPNQPCPLGCGPPRCQCRQGFVRHEGRCIRRYECPGQGPPNPPPNRCDRNEQFVTCSSMCEPTCQSRPNDPCPLGCGPPRCECLPGFVRHYGRCIPRYECPSYVRYANRPVTRDPMSLVPSPVDHRNANVETIMFDTTDDVFDEANAREEVITTISTDKRHLH
ncbi:hypothetical protein Tcan_09239 [Toxocara canis]|uniref:EGF-like domain-containing protein n=1 Tax=Toxocara canis TaxID=6265 RepID=A0A0B2VSW1_TOXCA|nr:hypothetical protein Tcan_09239 [Toxocara canis]